MQSALQFITEVFDGVEVRALAIKLISADVTKCYTETQPKTPNSKTCKYRSTVARKISIERQEPRKKHREEPGSEAKMLKCS